MSVSPERMREAVEAVKAAMFDYGDEVRGADDPIEAFARHLIEAALPILEARDEQQRRAM